MHFGRAQEMRNTPLETFNSRTEMKNLSPANLESPMISLSRLVGRPWLSSREAKKVQERETTQMKYLTH